MAAEVASMTNGYAPHNGFGGTDNQSNAYTSTPASQQSMYQQPPAQEMASGTSTQSDIPKDEVGWYFVEQYYTTLSRSPEKLYLFYNKRSQFVSGQETDKVPVCVGQRAINDRIKELDFQDCKVRVTNVDSQASDKNIVIQVIGEISNKSQPHKKFTQTFVLATQTNGYFVLNDIFRYLVEEEDEETEQPQQPAPQAEEEIQQQPAAESGSQEPPPTAADSGRETLTSSDNPAAIERDAQEVAGKLEETLAKPEEASAPTTNGESHEEEVEEEQEAAPEATTESSGAEPEVNGESATPAATEEVVQEEKPQAPTPSPAPTPASQAPAQPAAPPKPAVPKTWASLAASAARTAPAPVVPQAPSQPRQAAPKSQTQAPAQAQTQAPASTPAAAPASTPSAPAREETSTPTSQDEWTAVGSSHNRSQSRHVDQQQQQQGPQSRGYIKNVQEHVKPEELRAHLEQFGELIYFDISRPKTSAFVDFKTPQGYQAAVAANPHNICDSTLFVEERRVRPTNMQFGPRGAHNGQMQRGGRGGPGQGGPPRGGFNGRGGRGDFAPRGRGGAPRGRGAPAPAQ
ncbi:hypothetical protein LTR78_004834 [Recurvomyces mirabilis]|uniref:Uncharacterized protein n=1 Tax=Recurvomyces mirabilis TaxID=574656 RepID=A0AAE0WP19_9PEZI|nr:hypothetical protein LTR78_004834 [Recurvomyces mirabilis]KAK5158004.1 hypothetical protein LTS14_003927 [Recurvomyces mirabilis]